MEAVSFDLDGTLVRSTESRDRSLERVREAIDPSLPRLSVDVYRTAFREALAERLPNTAWELSVRRAAFERTFEAAGAVPPAPTLEAFVLAYRRRRLERLVPREGALEVLSATCRDPNKATVVVTNGPAGLQREKLRQTGLATRVDATAVAGRCGAMKPDSRPFEVAFDRAGASVEGAIHVGDSRSDIEGALRAGLEPVALDTDSESHPDDDATATCASLEEAYRRFVA